MEHYDFANMVWNMRFQSRSRHEFFFEDGEEYALVLKAYPDVPTNDVNTRKAMFVPDILSHIWGKASEEVAAAAARLSRPSPTSTSEVESLKKQVAALRAELEGLRKENASLKAQLKATKTQ